MTNFYGLPLEFQKIHEKCSYNTFFFLVGVSHSGLLKTNTYSSRIENCTQGTPDVKSSGLNHSATLPPFTANYEARVNAPHSATLPPFTANYEARVNAPRASSFKIVYPETISYKLILQLSQN